MSEPKRFKHDYTSLEQLPNELFIEVFTFLNGVDTIYAFSQLNTRLQSLLIQYVNIFDFQSVSKAKFDYVIEHHDIHQWQSLRLSNDDQTPGQIRLFSQLYPPHQYISHLQSLSAVNMTPKYAREFLSQLVSFDHLVSLEIGSICGEDIQSFELPSLKRLVITTCEHTSWMKKLHSLVYLEYSIECSCHYNNVLTLPTTLKHLKLVYEKPTAVNTIQTALIPLSQLTKLALYDNESHRSLPNGETWEKLIQSSLPLLKTFHFCFPFCQYDMTRDDINQVVASFSTPFYLLEKCWFIRCDTDARYPTMGTLYSLPFAFVQMPINITSFDESMSTLIVSDMNERKYDSYENVRTLLFNVKCQIPYRAFLTSNIVRLVLNADFLTSWHFLLSNLRHLEFKRSSNMSSVGFTDFLANTPHLQSLNVPMLALLKLTDKFTNSAVCDQLSQRIQSLTISAYYSYGGNLGIVSVRLLSSLVPIFGKTCKHLSLGLGAHPNTVLPVLRRMRQLRSLHIYYRPRRDRWENTAVCWIEEARKKANISDFMHTSDDYNFHIWFGNRL